MSNEKLYPIAVIAEEFFNKTPAWMYWSIREERFTYENGKEILPATQTKLGSKKHYKLSDIKEMALSLYRLKTLKEDELRDILKKIIVEQNKFEEDLKQEDA